MPTTVLLDMMGVVLVDPYVAAIEAGAGMPIAQAARVRDPQAWPLFEAGAIDEEEFVGRFFADGRPFDVEAFHRARRAGYRFVDGMEPLLGRLRGAAEVHIASNYPVWIHEVGQRFDFAERFDGVHASCELGIRKPAADFFARLLGRIERRPEECCFVDDRLDNCAAAEAAGIRAHAFTDADALEAWLRSEGLAL